MAPTPLVKKITVALEAQRGPTRQVKSELHYRCLNAEKHANGDTNPSARWNEEKGVFCCDVCGDSGGTKDLAERLDLIANGAKEKPKVTNCYSWRLVDNIGDYIADHIREDYDNGTKKMMWERNGNHGLDGLKTCDLPLYGLKWANEEPDDSERPWIICEGEKATDALYELDYLALGTVTGASTIPSKERLSVLLDRKGRIVLWPDHDPAGKNHMDMIAIQLNKMGIEVYVTNWADAPPKGDAYDFVKAGENVDDLLATAKKWEPQVMFVEIPPSLPSPSPLTTGIAPDVVKQICDQGFLKSYIDWASGYTDAPLAFHLATGLSLLATSMGNRYSTNAWGRPLYPNLWIVAISPSGFYRKTTCIRLGMRILKPELGGLILPTEWSRERLVAELAKNPAGLFEWDEFGFALAAMSRDYNSGTKEMLTKLFDSADSHSRATGQGQIGTIEKPAPNILAGSTIEWLQNTVKVGDLRGGFMSRILFIPGLTKESEKDFDTAFLPQVEKELSEWLVKLSKSKGTVMDFANVKSQIRDWVRTHEQQAEQNMHPDLMGFISRGETYLLKLCMVLAVSLDNTYPKITEEVLNKAILLLDGINQGVVQTVSDLAIPYGGKELHQLREMLKRNCPMTRAKALKNSHLPAKKFGPLLDTLEETGEVQTIEEEGQGQMKKMLYWRG